jgi:hypothetical protein
MIPQRPGLDVAEDGDTVVGTPRQEMVDLAVDDGSRTDPRVADASEVDHPRFARDFPLGHVMVGHLDGD